MTTLMSMVRVVINNNRYLDWCFSGIRTSLYGVHIFHTKYDRVKEYVSQFSEWIPYEHRVVAKAKDVKVWLRHSSWWSYNSMIPVFRVTTSLCPCPPTFRLSTCCLGRRSPRRRRWWPGSTRGDPHQVKLIFMKIQSLNSLPDTKPKNGEDMAISRVGKDLYKMLIKVSSTK